MSTFLKKELEDNNFLVEEITNGALVVHNFLSKEELDDCLDIINKTPDEEWHKEYERNLVRFCLTKFGRSDVENLVAEGKFEITQGWQDKNLDISQYPIRQKIFNKLNKLIQSADNTIELDGLGIFQRMQEGVKLQSHTDDHTDPSIKYATIIYLNNDYNGGEFFFKNKDIEIKPTPGSLLVFPGNEEFEHGVNPVKTGPIRYVLVGFIKIKNFYDKNKF